MADADDEPQKFTFYGNEYDMPDEREYVLVKGPWHKHSGWKRFYRKIKQTPAALRLEIESDAQVFEVSSALTPRAAHCSLRGHAY